VFFSAGYIEAHFHFFLALVVLAMYEDWLPFALGFAGVGISHVVFGLIDASRVYNHVAAMENPMVWGAIHALFVVGIALGLMAQWYSTERSRERVSQQLDAVEQKRAEIDDLEAKQAALEEAKAAAEAARTEAEEVVSMTADAADIGRETAEETASVSAAAEEQSASIRQISGNTTDLIEQAERLQELLSQFTVSGDTGQRDAARDAGTAVYTD